ncbi:MAG: helix-turn-helix transcriptional regulator [Candidatus Bathyarchaeota archaeon]|jgi:predicted transcriptional regulator|nr:helix-turn-helix transcriptional regulator [Candidatus Bathyarchaeota archaeon]UCC28296.1 MAG: helix-turn-helix transcriptional regulator [Candidatus Bathyarchaeota archaeon]UCD39948.1 MAG: helix-turn-helix transcriptional regulator [Candidatus Bathyarchaeota archaeon]
MENATLQKNNSDGEENVAKRRDRHDIIVEILKTAIDGKIKTHIMYKAKLSYAQINEYLALLVSKGFVEPFTVKQRKIRRKLYRTTEKGMRLLANFESMADLWA